MGQVGLCVPLQPSSPSSSWNIPVSAGCTYSLFSFSSNNFLKYAVAGEHLRPFPAGLRMDAFMAGIAPVETEEMDTGEEEDGLRVLTCTRETSEKDQQAPHCACCDMAIKHLPEQQLYLLLPGSWTGDDRTGMGFLNAFWHPPPPSPSLALSTFTPYLLLLLPPHFLIS